MGLQQKWEGVRAWGTSAGAKHGLHMDLCCIYHTQWCGCPLCQDLAGDNPYQLLAFAAWDASIVMLARIMLLYMVLVWLCFLHWVYRWFCGVSWFLVISLFYCDSQVLQFLVVQVIANCHFMLGALGCWYWCCLFNRGISVHVFCGEAVCLFCRCPNECLHQL